MMIRNVIRLVFLFCSLMITAGCTKTTQTSDAATVKKDIQPAKKLGVISQNYLENKELQGQLHPTVVVSKNGSGYAYIEPVGELFRVVANGKNGKLYKQVGDIAVSEDGSKVAYSATENFTFRKIVINGVEGPTFMEIGMPEFTSDGQHIVYTITQNEETFIAIDHKVHREYQIALGPLVISGSQQMAFATKPNKDGIQQFVLSDMSMQKKQMFDSCGETFAASDDMSQIAVVCREGDTRTVKVIDVKKQSVVSTGKSHSGGRISRLTFAPDNGSLAYTFVVDENNRYLVYNGKEVKIPAGDEFLSRLIVFAEPNGVGVIVGMAVRAGLFNAFASTPKNERNFGYISDFIASKDGRHHAYLAIETGGETLQRLVIDGNEGQKYEKIVSPLFSPDGLLVAYRARQDGKRFLVIADLNGKVVSKHKNYDMVFQPVFSIDGKSVAYAVLDGNELWWKVEKL